MKLKNIKQTILYLAAVGFSIFLLVFFISCVWIGYSAKDTCQDAQAAYGGDCVEALISLLEDENRSYRARNNAIWALGQFGDSRALPVLEKYYTRNIPNREPLNGAISQYELKKAIKLARGGTNLSAFIWRNSF